MSFYDQANETVPRERLRTLQFQKLQKLLGEISGRNRFYTKKWNDAGIVGPGIQSFADFQKLPFTYKSELVRAQEEAPPFGTNATFSVDTYTRVHQTSGTTGTPLRVVDTPESWEWWGDCWGHVMKAAAVTAADRVFLAFSFGPFIGFWATVEGARKIGAMVIPGRVGFHSTLAHDARSRRNRGVLHPNLCAAACGGCAGGTFRPARNAGSHADPRRRAGSKRGAHEIAH